MRERIASDCLRELTDTRIPRYFPNAQDRPFHHCIRANVRQRSAFSSPGELPVGLLAGIRGARTNGGRAGRPLRSDAHEPCADGTRRAAEGRYDGARRPLRLRQENQKNDLKAWMFVTAQKISREPLNTKLATKFFFLHELGECENVQKCATASWLIDSTTTSLLRASDKDQ